MRSFVLRLCREAGRILLDHQGRTTRHTEKPDAGFVTEADLASERFLLGELQREFPDCAILSEEAGAMGSGASRWIIDPLDGTTNFACGLPWYAISIALEVDGVLRLGAIYNPTSGECFLGERGRGLWLNEEPLRPAGSRELAESVLATGDYYQRGEALDRPLELLGRVYRRCRAVRTPGSVALALAYVAAGRFDGFWQEQVNAWDVAAGVLLVEEAGGLALALDGGPFAITPTASLVAGMPALVPQLLQALAAP